MTPRLRWACVAAVGCVMMGFVRWGGIRGRQQVRREIARSTTDASGIAQLDAAPECLPSAGTRSGLTAPASMMLGAAGTAIGAARVPAEVLATKPEPGMLPAPATVERMRAEVAANPHTTPPCILRFAAGWATHMQAAKSDAVLAERLVAQAAQWVGEGTSVAPVFHAIALNNAALLAAVHPALNSSYQAMRDRASTQVLTLARSNNDD